MSRHDLKQLFRTVVRATGSTSGVTIYLLLATLVGFLAVLALRGRTGILFTLGRQLSLASVSLGSTIKSVSYICPGTLTGNRVSHNGAPRGKIGPRAARAASRARETCDSQEVNPRHDPH